MKGDFFIGENFVQIRFNKRCFVQPSFSPATSKKWEHRASDSEKDNVRASSTDTIGSAQEATEVMSHASTYYDFCLKHQ